MTITGGNVNYRSPVMDLVKGTTAKLIGDKGYISKKLFEQKVTLITKIKKNIKNILMNMSDKIMLKKRCFI